MKTDYGCAMRYKERINHLIQNDCAKEILDVFTGPRTWYLPHFGVDNPNKKKLRLVFDAAAKYQTLSLNDYLLKGPDLLVSLLGIMMRFREQRIGVSGDIKYMFLRKKKILPEDKDALRFLWRDNPKEILKICAMTSLIFGANYSPFIAQFIKNKNAQRFELFNPAVVRAICEQHYMDDYIDSLHNMEEARDVVDISFICGQGDFDIRNWTSNRKEILESLPTEALGPTAVRFNIEQNSEHTLSLIWFPKKDVLSFDISFKRIPATIVSSEKIPTKREMLRLIMTIIEVFGFLSPFTIKGKLLLQETSQTSIDWNESLKSELYVKWTEWLKLLKNIDQVSLPRYYKAATRANEQQEDALNAPNISVGRAYEQLELHVFCDASPKAVCVVAYWRCDDKQKSVAFVASKCKVAPVKQSLSMPRLELQAAVLGARLANTIIKQHRIKPQRKYFWSDSTSVLHWIKNNARNYQTFVAHRLGEIDELTSSNKWRYVFTKLNITDAATREVCDMKFFSGEWLYGPPFLSRDKNEWPENLLRVSKSNLDSPECVTIIESTTVYLPVCPVPERFSLWLRLLKSTCVVLLFVDKKCKKLTGEIDGAMVKRAEQLLMRYAQMQSFTEELERLKKEKPLDKKSKLLTLMPILDEQGTLRVNICIDTAPEFKKERKTSK